MKVLFIGANCDNSRDGVIVKGIYNLISYYKIEIQKTYHFLEDYELKNDFDIPENFYDALVICGTPWLWDQFHKSSKYHNLLKIIKSQSKAKVMFLGVGSCIGLQHINGNLCEDDEHQLGIRNLFEGHTVIARDSLFHKKLLKSKVVSHLLPCPSFFCYLDDENNIESANNILLWCDPTKCISSCDWQNEISIKNYIDIFQEFYKNYQPHVYCAERADINMALQAGLPEPQLLNSWTDTLQVMKKANYVLSGRIHCLVPAFVLNKPVSIVPLDSRHMVLSEYGCPLTYDTNLQFGNIAIKLEKYLQEYGEILLGFFK